MSQDPRTIHAPDQNQESRAARVSGNPQMSATDTAVELLKQYAEERPTVVALWIFGIGFVLGWKLKPW